MHARREEFAGLETHSTQGVVCVRDLACFGFGPSVRRRLVRTAAARVWKLDGFTVSPEDQVELALECALHQTLTTVERLADLLRDGGERRDGADVLRAVLAHRMLGIAVAESRLETRMVQIPRNAGIVNVERQVWIFDRRGVRIGRVDLKIGAVIIECDGREFHPDFEEDRARWAALHAIGYLVLPVSFRMVEVGTTELLRSLRDLSAKATENRWSLLGLIDCGGVRTCRAPARTDSRRRPVRSRGCADTRGGGPLGDRAR